MAIRPGVILVPSDIIILKNPIEDFNNILTEANDSMEFGVKKTLNMVKHVKLMGSGPRRK